MELVKLILSTDTCRSNPYMLGKCLSLSYLKQTWLININQQVLKLHLNWIFVALKFWKNKSLILWGAVLLFIPCVWIHFWISKSRFMDILKYIVGYPKISWILDIHNSIFWYPKMNYGYPKMHPDFWISINQFLISKNQLYIGYP